jgi:uncharacterized Zn-binding protein involved in type VI secretion
MHTCPVPTHVGGPTIVGDPTVLIGYMPAARVGDALICATGPDTIARGESTVKIGHKQAARLGDSTTHGGVLVAGCPTVLIGSTAQIEALKTDKPICEECEKAAKQHPRARAPLPRQRPRAGGRVRDRDVRRHNH